MTHDHASSADQSAVARGVSARARVALSGFRATGAATATEPESGLLASLHHHLHGGETHYPARPGMVPLREAVGDRLPRIGHPRRQADGVLITTGEGESLLVSLLGLGTAPDGRLVAVAGGRHQRLLDWLDVHLVAPDSTEAETVEVAYSERMPGGSTASGVTSPTGGPQGLGAIGAGAVGPIHIEAVGGQLFTAEGSALSQSDNERGLESGLPKGAEDGSRTVVIGDLADLPGMEPFSLGFVAGEPELVARITKWKQASSICSPAPSQRAALWALGARP